MRVRWLLAMLLAVNAHSADTRVTKRSFGRTREGVEADLYTLHNARGMMVSITTYGGAVVMLRVPDREGKIADVVLGCDNVRGYQEQNAYFGALIGRYGNRIGKGQFALNGVTYQLPKNDGSNTLHGGFVGFDKRVWAAKETSGAEGPGLELTYLSKDGEEGFPGNLSVTVSYTLTEKNELKIEYRATTDRPTILNLTNHSYFNLAGEGQGDILQHRVKIFANRFTPVDAGLIPTGALQAVKGTPFDFTTAKAIGTEIGKNDPQLRFGRGYDHNWVLDEDASLHEAAEVFESRSGRVMEVWTTEPGLQFYSGNFLDGSIHGKGGKAYPHRGAFCMETQHFPDSPNHGQFPSTTLLPGATYRSTTIYRFAAK